MIRKYWNIWLAPSIGDALTHVNVIINFIALTFYTKKTEHSYVREQTECVIAMTRNQTIPVQKYSIKSCLKSKVWAE